MAKRVPKPSFKTISLNGIDNYLEHASDKAIKEELRQRGYTFTRTPTFLKTRGAKIKEGRTKAKIAKAEAFRNSPDIVVNPVLWCEIAKVIAKGNIRLGLKYMESVRPDFIGIDMLLKLHRLYQEHQRQE